jgi:large subunit ribosomal protein L3
MTRIFEDNKHVPVTVLAVEKCVVTDVKTIKRDGYAAVQLGMGTAKDKRISKPVAGHLKKSGAKSAVMGEFRVSIDCALEIGDELAPSHFVKGQFVDVQGTSIGKGFAGGMKRWNFRGLEASHGVSVSHRSLGSTGQRQDPGKVFRGKKMPGHLGHETITVQNLVVMEANDDDGYILVKGAVPGAEGSVVYIKDAVKRAAPKDAPFPAGLKSAKKAEKETPDEEAKASPAEEPAAAGQAQEAPAETSEIPAEAKE